MKISDEVKKLEDENARLKKAVRGNCVLRNREGFEKPMEVDSTFLHGYRGAHEYREPLGHIRLWERRQSNPFERAVFDNVGVPHSLIKEVTYHNTGNLDEFGRVILEEI